MQPSGPTCPLLWQSGANGGRGPSPSRAMGPLGHGCGRCGLGHHRPHDAVHAGSSVRGRSWTVWQFQRALALL
eukprot:7425746-Alexandrium_andersonii.AAC.1